MPSRPQPTSRIRSPGRPRPIQVTRQPHLAPRREHRRPYAIRDDDRTTPILRIHHRKRRVSDMLPPRQPPLHLRAERTIPRQPPTYRSLRRIQRPRQLLLSHPRRRSTILHINRNAHTSKYTNSPRTQPSSQRIRHVGQRKDTAARRLNLRRRATSRGCRTPAHGSAAPPGLSTQCRTRHTPSHRAPPVTMFTNGRPCRQRRGEFS